MIAIAATVLNALWQDALLVVAVWLVLHAWPVSYTHLDVYKRQRKGSVTCRRVGRETIVPGEPIVRISRWRRRCGMTTLRELVGEMRSAAVAAAGGVGDVKKAIVVTIGTTSAAISVTIQTA